ncbi:MAG TPA: ATP-binding protein [Thermoanaerobaculia bacterium]
MQALGLSLLFVTVASAVFWFVVFFIPGQRQAAIDTWRRDLDARAEIRKEALQRYLIDGLADAETFAAHPWVLEALSARSAGSPRPAADAGPPDGRLEQVFSDFSRIHRVLGVVLWDAEGKPCVKSRDLVLESLCSIPAREVLASGAPAPGFHLHEGVGAVLTFSAPVRFENGNVRGALVIVVNPHDWLFRLLAQPLAGTFTGEALLVGRDGADALFLSPLRHRPNAPLSLRRPLSDPAFAARSALEGSLTDKPYVDYRGVRILAGSRRVPPSPWALVVKIDETEALADFRVGVRRAALAWGSLAVAFLGIIWGIWQMRGRRQAAALKESEARLRSLFDGMLEGYAHCEVVFERGEAVDWVYLDVNPAFEMLTGLKDVVGRRVTEVIPDFRKANPGLLEIFGRVASTGESRIFEDHVPGLKRWYAMSAYSPRKGEFVAVFDDVSQRKEAERALWESRARLEAAFASMTDAVFVSDATGQFIEFNEAFATFHRFRNKAECARRFDEYPEILEVFMDDGKPAPLDMWAVPRALRGETATNAEYKLRRKDTGETWFGSYGFGPIRDKDGAIVGSVVIGSDITERKRSEMEILKLNQDLEGRIAARTAELTAANNELEAFSYSVSHDLRAPLRAVDGFSRILLEDHAPQLDAEGKRLLGVVRTNTRQMGQLIDDLLSFSRVGRQGMTRSSLDMMSLAKAAFGDVQGAGEVVSFASGSLPRAEGDPSLMRQVWVNLISNALKFTRPKAERAIEIAGRTEPGRVVYSVKDNGVGFDMAYSNKLFGVFQRLHSSHEFEGTGVGLALVQRIVHRHGGEVWAEGKVGEGATFSFSLPRPGGSS